MELSMNAVLLLAVTGLNLLIGLYVFSRNPGSGPNSAFALMAGTTGLWCFGVALARYGPDHLSGAQLAWAAGALIPPATLHFVESFPTPSKSNASLGLTLLSLPLAFLALSPFVVTQVSIGTHGLRVS